MKTKRFLYLCVAMSITFFACNKDDSSEEEKGTDSARTSEKTESIKGSDGEAAEPSVYDYSEEGGIIGGENGGGTADTLGNKVKPGLLTAGEWNDLDNWGFWVKLLNNNNYYEMPKYWRHYPKNLVAVRLTDAGNNVVPNVRVTLLGDGKAEFSTKTDNAGLAYCWINLFDSAAIKAHYSLKIDDGFTVDSVKLTTKADTTLNINNIVLTSAKQPSATADVAFIVDATGSMIDEIDFLKADLVDIISRANSQTGVELRTGALFYRDVEDEYLTRADNFSTDVQKTQQFVAAQRADGGGDYPEAVHTALAAALQNLSWNESARARIAFLILDAPAHHEEGVIKSLQNSISLFAQNGIKIIPVAASGADKETEFMLRFFDLATGGTYVFLTDDSGIGGSHIEASVGDYEVEALADIMVRLIEKYVK